MKCKVEIPFHLIATNTDHKPGDIIEVSEEQLAKIRAVNVNMVSVLGDVVEQEVPEQPKVEQEEVEQEVPEQEQPEETEPEQVEPKKPKAKRTKKQ